MKWQLFYSLNIASVDSSCCIAIFFWAYPWPLLNALQWFTMNNKRSMEDQPNIEVFFATKRLYHETYMVGMLPQSMETSCKLHLQPAWHGIQNTRLEYITHVAPVHAINFDLFNLHTGTHLSRITRKQLCFTLSWCCLMTSSNSSRSDLPDAARTGARRRQLHLLLAQMQSPS